MTGRSTKRVFANKKDSRSGRRAGSTKHTRPASPMGRPKLKNVGITRAFAPTPLRCRICNYIWEYHPQLNKFITAALTLELQAAFVYTELAVAAGFPVCVGCSLTSVPYISRLVLVAPCDRCGPNFGHETMLAQKQERIKCVNIFFLNKHVTRRNVFTFRRF